MKRLMRWMIRFFVLIAGIWLVSSIVLIWGQYQPAPPMHYKPWETEYIDIPKPGIYTVPIDDRKLYFEMPDIKGFDSKSNVKRVVAKEIDTRGEKQKQRDKLLRGVTDIETCFAISKEFFPFDIPFGFPLSGTTAQFSIAANLYVETSPALRNLPGISTVRRGDFSKPVELFEYLRRSTGYYVDKSKLDADSLALDFFYSPIEEVEINGRKWYHYYSNGGLYPDNLSEYYVSGLAPDRYLEISVWQSHVPLAAIGYPYPATGYPTYPSEDKMPWWMKITHKFKEQVIHSLRITHPEGSKQPDLYEVPASSAASH